MYSGRKDSYCNAEITQGWYERKGGKLEWTILWSKNPPVF